MDLYIIRHADPDYENDTITEYGKQQAEALGKRLARENIDYIYSSPSTAAFSGLDCMLAIHGYRSLNGVYVGDRPNNSKIALFSHGFIGATILSYLLGMSINRIWAGTSLWTKV